MYLESVALEEEYRVNVTQCTASYRFVDCVRKGGRASPYKEAWL